MKSYLKNIRKYENSMLIHGHFYKTFLLYEVQKCCSDLFRCILSKIQCYKTYLVISMMKTSSTVQSYDL